MFQQNMNQPNFDECVFTMTLRAFAHADWIPFILPCHNINNKKNRWKTFWHLIFPMATHRYWLPHMYLTGFQYISAPQQQVKSTKSIFRCSPSARSLFDNNFEIFWNFVNARLIYKITAEILKTHTEWNNYTCLLNQRRWCNDSG